MVVAALHHQEERGALEPVFIEATVAIMVEKKKVVMVLNGVLVVEEVTMEEVEQLPLISFSVLVEVFLFYNDRYLVLYNENINIYIYHRWIKFYRRM